KAIAEDFAMPAWSGTCALGELDDDAELSAMPAAAPPSAQMAPVAATITILDLFIGIAPSLGDLGASSAVGEECGSKLNIRCETREGERRRKATQGHPQRVPCGSRTGGRAEPNPAGACTAGQVGGQAQAERLGKCRNPGSSRYALRWRTPSTEVTTASDVRPRQRGILVRAQRRDARARSGWRARDVGDPTAPQRPSVRRLDRAAARLERGRTERARHARRLPPHRRGGAAAAGLGS